MHISDVISSNDTKTNHNHAFIQQRTKHSMCYVHVNLLPDLPAFLVGVFFMYFIKLISMTTTIFLRLPL